MGPATPCQLQAKSTLSTQAIGPSSAMIVSGGRSTQGFEPTGTQLIQLGVKYAEGAGVTVEVSGVTHWPNLPVAEKSTEGDGAYYLSKEIGIVVGAAVEVLASSEAGKQKGTLGASGRVSLWITREHGLEVIR